jgi:hypothetical protein
MLQTRGFLIFSVLCASFVGGCFSSGTTNATKEEAPKPMDKEAEALALELNDNSVHMQPKPDLSSEEKLQKVRIFAQFCKLNGND